MDFPWVFHKNNVAMLQNSKWMPIPNGCQTQDGDFYRLNLVK
jgi:hypothetical protein